MNYRSYGCHYVIHLKQPINLFDDLLPMCIKNRHMLTFYKNNPCIITVLPYQMFDPIDSLHLQNVERAMNEITRDCYLFNDDNFQTLKIKYPDLFLYYNVFIYSTEVKGKTVVERISDSEYEEILSKRGNFKQFTIQSILHDSKKVIEIESGITNLILTQEKQLEK